MLSYLDALWAGTADPFWPHVILILLSILAAFTVAAGILYERPKYSEAIHRIATWLVIGGVAVESLCTVLLFAFDERISNTQQSKILFLEAQIAPRALDDAQVAALSSVKGKVNAVNIMTEQALEPSMFAQQILAVLLASGVRVRSWLPSQGMMMTGLMILYPRSMDEVGNLEEEPLYKAFKDARLTPSAASLKNFFPAAMDIPRDLPLIFVEEKYMLPEGRWLRFSTN
jgi:hypothetical protein